MPWLYVRSKPNEKNPGTHVYYAGRTKYVDFHDRIDSRGAGNFAIGIYGETLAVETSSETSEAHYAESEAIQFLVAFFGFKSVGNNTQLSTPVTGFQWDNTPYSYEDIKKSLTGDMR